jgi:hypothetical protein
MLSPEQRNLLEATTIRYKLSLPGSRAEEYLAERGLLLAAEQFQLGAVVDPLPEHDRYRGMLAIPYLRWDGHKKKTVVSMRFRCLEDHEHSGHGKYNTVSGDTPRLFNTVAIITNDDTICITEGEIDAMAAALCGVPAVGVPGANSWQPHFAEPFIGFETVWVLADGDIPGRTFADTVSKSLPNARVMQMPDGMDVDSVRRTEGVDALKQRGIT